MYQGGPPGGYPPSGQGSQPGAPGYGQAPPNYGPPTVPQQQQGVQPYGPGQTAQPYGQAPGQPIQPYAQPQAPQPYGQQYTGGNVMFEQGAVGAPASAGGIFQVIALVVAILAMLGVLVGLIPIPYVGGILTVLAMGTGFLGVIFGIISVVSPSQSKALGTVATAMSGFVLVVGLLRLLLMHF